MKRIRIFTILIAAGILADCALPVGNIGGSPGSRSSDFDTLWLVPNRVLYDIDSDPYFEREHDFRIFVGADEIPTTDPDVTIDIIPSTLSTTTEKPYYDIGIEHKFLKPGRYDICVSYPDKEPAHYSVEVRGLYSEPGDGSDFFHIEWW